MFPAAAFPSQNPREFLNLMLPHLFRSPAPFNTTSLDGKPFINPFQCPQFFSQVSVPPMAKSQQPAHTGPIVLQQNRGLPGLSHIPVTEVQGKRTLDIMLNQDDKSKKQKEDPLDYAKKKVKLLEVPMSAFGKTPFVDNEDQSTVCMASPQKSEESSQSALDLPLPQLSKTASSVVIVEPRKINPKENVCIIDEERKLKSILQPAYNTKTQALNFKVECESESKPSQVVMMTRDEILKEDPMSLVYFYEKRLQFHRTTGFNPEDLKKL